MDSTSTERSFEHLVAFYSGDEGFVERTLPFVREGIAADEPVRVMTSPEKCDRLAAALDGDLGRVELLDLTEIGRNPACILPLWTQFAERHGDRPMRGIGEPVWPERTGPELDECEIHEALINLAFAGGPQMRLLCPYDTAALDPGVIDRARRTHPTVVANGAPAPNPAYAPPDSASPPLHADLAPAPPDAAEQRFGPDTLAGLRDFVLDRARDAGLGGERAEDFTLAAHELAANSVRHGGGEGVLRAWSEPGTAHCEVTDAGSFTEPLAGRRLPPPTEPGGRGLWVVHHLTDLTQVRSLPDGGTVVRIRLAREG